jgi:hypothetical protein
LDIIYIYILKKKKKKTEKWGRGVNCEEEMREKNEKSKGGCMCVVGEKKKERQEGTWVVGEIKGKKKKWGVIFTCMVGKRGSGNERRRGCL